ncbi:MAG TPA: type II secretion system F family protein [Methylomirabilota bacterium]|nr:type II secretion system F family protein [Methylomirabilota bacterium]
MVPIPYLILTFIIVGGITFLTAALLLRWWPQVRQERLQGAAPGGGPPSILRWEDQTSSTPWQRIIERLGRVATPRDSAKISRVRQRLARAGYHNPRAVGLFVGAKVACAILFGYLFIYGILIAHKAPPLWLSIGLAVLSYFLPDLWLRKRIQSRQRAVRHALPDVLDLLMVCVEAGMGFDAAVARIVEQPESQRNPLLQEMQRMHLEVRAGRPRDEALRALGDRTGVHELKAIVAAFIQTYRLGASIGKTLRVHAETARVERRHRAEEKGYLAPLKMLFPTVVFLMPAFFLVAMAPALIGVLQALKTIGK